MNPALDAPFLPLPQLAEPEDPAPPAAVNPVPMTVSIREYFKMMQEKNADIRALNDIILAQEKEIARLKLDALNWMDKSWLDLQKPVPKCFPTPGEMALDKALTDAIRRGTGVFRIPPIQPHPPAAPVQSIMSQAQCQQSREHSERLLAQPSPFAQLMRSNLDSDN